MELVLLLLALLGAIGFFGRISEISLGEGRLSISLREVERRQEDTERTVEALRLVLEGIVTKHERQHLEKLLPRNDDTVRFGPHFFAEIERLDAIDFIQPVKRAGMVAIRDEHGTPGEPLHLREYARLTRRGRQYLAIMGELGPAEG